MILEEIMKRNMYTLSENDSIQTAFATINEKKIRHIPIVNDSNNLVGLVSDRDLRDAAPSIFRADYHPEDLERPVSTIMKTDLITGHPLDFVEETAVLFYEHNISCLPVIKDHKLVGIITETDLLHTFVELTGANQPGSQIEVKVPNKSGKLLDISVIIKKRNANIQSVLVYPDKNDSSYKILVIRVSTMNPFQVADDLKKEGYTVLWPNLPGISS
ncbi:acetoin utilization protein AcuB [Bacillus sp. M6-12]|uniref:acetoin utilization AcuB family protein n=1 Tax=Bacillus sp. M6-12 TaxID=2054166 RepID=UPI000C76ED69|nr:acetoin utilization AcuB family protein [Bacillus sp. M6-12]PLS14865.1 acetoin utilization protein AcuB [Bacillus sp. M6-12]